MQPALYVALSGQIALERRLTTIAQNVANAGTVGFRAEEVHFESLVSAMSNPPAAFSSAGNSYLSERTGGLSKTGNPLDVAVRGDGWMAIQTPAGTAYTRDGRMRLLESGELQTLNGYPVLDVGGAPILLDAAAGPAQIANDGMITQAGKQLGAIGLFNIDLGGSYRRFENSAVMPSRPAAPVLDFAVNGLVQGFVEESNVDAVSEMARLIMVTRTFESLAAATSDSEQAMKNAIQTLGSG